MSCFLLRPHLLDVDQEVGEPALDGFQMAEPRVGDVEPLHQAGDAVFEVADRDIIAPRILNLLNLVGQRMDQRFQPRRHAVAVLRAFGERLA
jgi:hypothetical protein